MDTVTLKVFGMTCQHCVQTVKGALEKLPGVKSALVTLDQGIVKVEFDKSSVNQEQLKNAVVESGYEVS
jgi:copper chaperone